MLDICERRTNSFCRRRKITRSLQYVFYSTSTIRPRAHLGALSYTGESQYLGYGHWNGITCSWRPLETRCLMYNRWKITRTVVPGGATYVTRPEFNAALGLLACAQNHMGKCCKFAINGMRCKLSVWSQRYRLTVCTRTDSVSHILKGSVNGVYQYILRSSWT